MARKIVTKQAKTFRAAGQKIFKQQMDAKKRDKRLSEKETMRKAFKRK